jgi:5-methyltetrahydropteroyltriglutamate--homocysteine methyltransferase
LVVFCEAQNFECGIIRRLAYYKIVAIVLGTNTVRKELGLPLAECLAADERYSLVVPTK